ncbi:MAG TPA: DHA2 family efflux MFS transporter permease subunit [Thermoanaerobaculia bacterium]|nr:DHA2 family efflux MFS transporter permease subunit [Thermoanaerobaculia bacterium]
MSVANPAQPAGAGGASGIERAPSAIPVISPWVISMVVMLSTFMEVLDTSIANVSLPHIAGSLSATQDESTWVLTSYLVANAIVLPLSGWLSNLFGRKPFYMTCVVLFTLSSFLCGLAWSLPMLIFFRILQGLGGGGLQPSTQAILADSFPPEKRGMGFAVYAMAVVLAPAIGPTLGGWITDNYSWRWIFYINVPVGVIAVVLTSRLIHDPPYLVERVRQLRGKIRIDYIGIGLLSVGLGFLQVVLDKGQEEDWFGSHFIVFCSILAAGALVAVVLWELTRENPIVDLRLFKERNFAISNVLIFGLGFALFGSTVLVPQFLQNVLGYTAMESGKVLSPSGFVVMALLPVTGVLSNRISARKLISFGFLLAGCALWLTSHINLEVDYWTITFYRLFQGAGIAFLFTPISTACFSRLPPEKSNAASSLFNLSRNLGASFGIATVISLVSRYSQIHHNDLVANTAAGNPAYRSLLSGLTRRFMASGSGSYQAAQQAQGTIAALINRQAGAMAYLDCFRMTALFCFALIPLCWLLKPVLPQKGGRIHVE